MQLYRVDHDDIVDFKGRGKRAPGTLVHEQEFANEEYTKQNKGWKDVYADFIAASEAASGQTGLEIRTLSLAVAGPVENNKVRLWVGVFGVRNRASAYIPAEPCLAS